MIRKAGYLGVGVVLGAAAAATAPQALLFVSPAAYAAAADTYRQLNLFGDVFDKIRNDYVEKPDESKMIEAAINGMLSSLDPHSSYMDAKAFRDMQVQTKGEFGGLGIEVTQEDGLLKVVTPIDDTPAAKAGVMSGDIITAIDDTSTQGLTLDQAVEKMRGSINSPVKLKVVRGPKKDVKEFTIVRDLIHVQSVRSHVEDGDIGYIRITQFTEQTADGLKSAMEKLRGEIPADKFKGYILDLRNNPGGLLDQSIDVVNSFVDRGEIVSTRGRTPDETQRFDAKPGGDLSAGKPLVVLINGGSASASEIVSGALQDHKRATLIGTRSFGKGSVQTIMPLGENGALRLTTARYYTPSGRSIQAKGIEPDIKVLEDVPDDLKGKDDMKGEASLKGHLANGAEDTSASQAYVPPNEKDDKQLTAAIDLLHGVKHPEPAVKADAAPVKSDQPATLRQPIPAKRLPPSRIDALNTSSGSRASVDEEGSLLSCLWSRRRRSAGRRLARRPPSRRLERERQARALCRGVQQSPRQLCREARRRENDQVGDRRHAGVARPASNYFDPKALQDFQSSMKGEEFGGLGLEVMMEGGLVKVVSPIDDTPAARAGMMSGDLVTRIDDTAVKGLSPQRGG